MCRWVFLPSVAPISTHLGGGSNASKVFAESAYSRWRPTQGTTPTTFHALAWQKSTFAWHGEQTSMRCLTPQRQRQHIPGSRCSALCLTSTVGSTSSNISWLCAFYCLPGSRRLLDRLWPAIEISLPSPSTFPSDQARISKGNGNEERYSHSPATFTNI